MVISRSMHHLERDEATIRQPLSAHDTRRGKWSHTTNSTMTTLWFFPTKSLSAV